MKNQTKRQWRGNIPSSIHQKCVGVLFMGIILCGVQIVSAQDFLDQENNPTWNGGATNIQTENEVGQSFQPSSCRNLSRVDVNFIYQGGEGSVTAKILRNGLPITGAHAQTFISQNGWVQLDLDNVISVTAEEPLVLRLESDAHPLPLWKYNIDTYPRGTRLFNGKVLRGDFFFRTYCSASTYSGVYTGNFSGGSNQGSFSMMINDNDVATILAFDLFQDDGLATTNVAIQSDGSFSLNSADREGTSISGTVIAGSSVLGTLVGFEGVSGVFSGSARPNNGLFASNGGYYVGTSTTIPAQCFGISNITEIHAIISADGSIYFYTRDQDGFEDGGVTTLTLTGLFTGTTVDGATFSGSLSGNSASGSGINFLTFADDGIDGACNFNFSINRVETLPTQFGTDELDTDSDGIGNNADLDDDNDGLPDVWEIANGTNTLIADENADIDNDGITNLEEYLANVEDQTAFIERFYLNTLNRTADQVGLDYWLNEIQIKSGTLLVLGFLKSPEFINLQLSDPDFINILYGTLFDRLADQVGYDYWMAELEAGSLREMVIYGFVRSQEFQNLATSFGVTAFNEEDNILFQIKSFVERFYQLVLNREPDEGGFNDWSTQLADPDGTRTGGDIARGFFLSPEFTNRQTTNNEFLHIAYWSFFDRAADADGKQNWIDDLSLGASREDVINGFIGSQEFINLADRFGIRAN